MTIGQIISPEIVIALNDNPAGLFALCVVLGVWVIGLLLRNRNLEREARTRIMLAEQANLTTKLESERQERLGFFKALSDIRDYTGAVWELVQKTTAKDAKADTRDDAMVKTLNSITDRLNSLGDKYTALAISDKAITDNLNIARELLEKMPIIESDVKETLQILKRVETVLQMPITRHDILSTNTDQ